MIAAAAAARMRAGCRPEVDLHTHRTLDDPSLRVARGDVA
jgi:hypothetical protein